MMSENGEGKSKSGAGSPGGSPGSGGAGGDAGLGGSTRKLGRRGLFGSKTVTKTRSTTKANNDSSNTSASTNASANGKPPSGKRKPRKKKAGGSSETESEAQLRQRLEEIEAEKQALAEDLAQKDYEVYELNSKLEGATELLRDSGLTTSMPGKLSAVGEDEDSEESHHVGATQSKNVPVSPSSDSLNARRGSAMTARRDSNSSTMTDYYAQQYQEHQQPQQQQQSSSPTKPRPTLKGASDALMNSTRIIGRQSVTPDQGSGQLSGAGTGAKQEGGAAYGERKSSRRPSDALTGFGGSRRGNGTEVSKRSTSFIAKVLNEHLSKQNELRRDEQDGGASNQQSQSQTQAQAQTQSQAKGKSDGKEQKSATLSQKLQVSGSAKGDRKDSPSSSSRPASQSRSRSNTAKSAGESVSSIDSRKLPNRSASYLRRMLAHKTQAKGRSASFETSEKVIHLPRGGVYVNTSFGAVQFGMPPETVKDSMTLGLPVPTIFVVPNERFNLSEGVNVSEIEFPAFFNFFVLKKKIRLVTYPEYVEDLRAIMQEALLGPGEDDIYVDDEYSKFVSPEVYASRPNLVKEMEYFATPRPPFFYQIDIDNLLQFEFFDEETGIIDVGGGVKLKDNGDSEYEVIDSGQAEEDETIAESLTITYEEASSCLKVHPSQKAAENAQGGNHTFAIPQFGVTVLGNSHGFDPEGSTSGFVVWVNGQGVMVDPPPHSSSMLVNSGIMPKFVTAIILTHCHADHEVGTIQKMVTEDKITLMTTPTIFESFLRKYAAVSGLDTEFLRQLAIFRPVFLEEPTYWNGANFRFFYSLHSIPCVGFEVTFSGKRLVYSADTYYDKQGLQEMHDQGVLSRDRLDALLSFPWDCDVVLHEAGVPPIHTPVEALETLPKNYQKNIHLIHIGGKAARDAQKRGFKIATAGVEHTIILKEPNEEENKILKILQLLSGMDIFRGFGVHQALELLFMATEAHFKKGEIVVEQGTPGDKFLIIVKGAASVTFGGAKKVFVAGDYLGEISVITGATRTATVIAETDLTALEVDRYAFDYLVMHDPTLKSRMENLIKSRSDGSWRAIMHNSVLSTLSASQKTQLQALLTVRALRRGDVVWRAGEHANIGVLISKGGFRFEEVHGKLDSTSKAPKENESQLTTGMLIFDMFGYLNAMPLTTTLVCETQVALIFTFDGEEMIGYLDQNPLLMLSLLKSGILLV